MPAAAWRLSASAAAHACASSMRFSPASTSRGTSHYELLRAFADDLTLRVADEEMAAHGYRPHEFGDSVLVIPDRPL